jgi:hypothetical protein
MREFILPLVVVALVSAALLARRTLHPPLSGFAAFCAAVSLIAYAGLEVFPWVRGLSFFQPIRVQIEPQTSFGAQADGQPTEIAVQVFRGSQLLDEKRIPGLGKAATLPAREPLRLVPLDSGSGYRVMAGKTSLGELSGEALAEAGVEVEMVPDVGGPPPEAKPEIDIAANDAIPPGDRTPAAELPSTPDVASAPTAPTASKAKIRLKKRPAASGEDREVELRARASQLSRQGSNCEGERLLREQGRDERSQALARELAARCSWKGR